MRGVERRAAEAYERTFSKEPEVVASAPGRVNLIGEHTDYNEGFVLPCAIDRRVAVALGRAGEGEEGSLYSADFGETVPERGEREGFWADYPRSVVWALRRKEFDFEGFRAAFAGDVPRGAGLSSSAAIEAATALALNALFGFGLDGRELAALCQEAENEFVGVSSGIMDQYASLLCRAGSALLIDCRSLRTEPVPLGLDAAGLSLLVCDTRVKRALAGTRYNERRRTCERAAKRLGLGSLRDATPEDLGRLRGEELRRARHVVNENSRVLEAVEALRERDFSEFGRLMYVSHRSLRDDYEVSIPPLDAFVETARGVGILGARLTGAGFGGCAVALVAESGVESLKAHTRKAFDERGFKEPVFYRFLPVAGAQATRRRPSSPRSLASEW